MMLQRGLYESTNKGDVVKRSDCILVYGSTAKGGVVKRANCTCIPVMIFIEYVM